MPISRVRSLTEPIMVTNTTSASMPMITPATTQLKARNWSMACMRFLTCCCMAVTLVPGSTPPSWETIFSTGQSLQSAATWIIEILPGLSSTPWAAARSVISRPSSWEPVGRRIPVTVNGRPSTLSTAPVRSLSAVATAEPATSSWPFRGGRPSTLPPLLEVELVLWLHAHEQAVATLHLDGAEQLGRDDGDVAAVGDRRDARQVGLPDVLLPGRRGAERDAAVAEREPVGPRRHHDVGAVRLQAVLRLHRERLAQGEQRDHGPDADQQAGDQERGARLAALQVAEGDGAERSTDQKYCAPWVRLSVVIVSWPPETACPAGSGCSRR